MAAYPSYSILLGSDQDLESGWKDSVSSSGTLHSQARHGKQYYRFNLLHSLTGTQFETHLALYASDPRAVHTLTYRSESPQITYSAQMTGPPQITRNLGGGRYEVRVPLRGFKD